MTFIASVIAKDGVAIVADSFVTTSERSISEDKFLVHLNAAENKEAIGVDTLIGLFERRPSHTRNYVDKLIKFDDFSAITITGSAYINDKEINDVIKAIAAEMTANEAEHNAKEIDQVLSEFCNKIKSEILTHLGQNHFSPFEFIFSHYNRRENKPQVFIIRTKFLEKDNFDENDPDIITVTDQSNLGIVTDGQDTYVDRLIFGTLYTNINQVKREVIDKVVDVLQLDEAQQGIVNTEIQKFEFLQNTVTKDMFSINFRELSLQEAINFAALLLKIVMDIQVYTEKIPTVGGIMRLAYIHKERGFHWVTGNSLEIPKIM
ncbi:hypothetical protein [Mucilaginibacter sp. L3T2-6]|uniref:hypothetical protein n=1 Tax=Mucilaginibacter sp. L3T2-6 TaxID=3062491 RepID=UPI002675612E|nr:hypothetical protein [Mucilaginibacter sp. L3T2-6]MDO3641776.1 hypothetical protein [Mucilaginibacter sp. L3T2-6]MDV6214270.1 hypothetical protein [Mucilaginibacter sp. L3T2-6]